jgi:uncharacterized protein YaeQ
MSTAVSLAVANAVRQPNNITDSEFSQKQLDEISELVSRTTSINKNVNALKNKVLWVDDRPDNNIYNKESF